MPTELPKRIHLVNAGGLYEEGRAAAVITPGMLVAIDTNGELIPHGVAGGPAARNIAIEDALQGRGIDDDYADDELVRYIVGVPGDTFYALLSGGEAVTRDDFLSSNGDGTLKVASSTDDRLFIPVEAVDASDSNDVNERIKVRAI